MSTSLPRKTLTVGVMAGFMVCTAMVNAQNHRLRQRDIVVPTIHVEGGISGIIGIADQDQSAGCPASSCVTQPGQCTLVQNLDTEETAGTVRCQAPIEFPPDSGEIVRFSTPNGFARSFNMATEGIQCGNFTVASVTFGVGSVILTGDLVDIAIDIVIYADSDGGAPPSPGSAGPLDPTITELARETIFVTPADIGTFITVPIVAVLEAPLGGDLIVEIEQLSDGTEEPLHHFTPSSSNAGACGETYLRAASCGIPGWIALCGGIGFCANELVLIVEGKLGGPCCPATSCSNICNCSLTQTATENIVEIVACALDGTTPQSWARCFDFAAEEVPNNQLGYTIQSVTFGVLFATVDGIEVDVVVYTDNDGCPADTQAPGDGTVTEIARESILVNTADVGTLITVPLSGKPKVPDDVSIIVEIEQLQNGAFGGFEFRPAGNKNAECETSYLRAAFGCGINDWTRFDGLPIPGAPTQVVIIVDIAANKVQGLLDIKPGSCPNPLNRNSNGVLPVALVGTAELNAADVDLSTLQIHRADGVGAFVDALSGRPGPKRNLEDVATPFGGELCDCHTLGSDGNLDVQMKFDIAVLRAALELDSVPKRTMLELCVTGRLNDGRLFIACDCVRIQGRGAPR